MKIKILCTLGPASLNEAVIRGLDERNVDLFRFNLSHTPPEAVIPTIELIRRYSKVPICLSQPVARAPFLVTSTRSSIGASPASLSSWSSR